MDQPSIEIAQLPAQFAALLARTQPGGSILITEGGQPRALLTPLAGGVTDSLQLNPDPALAQPAETTGYHEYTVTFQGKPMVIREPIDPNIDPDAPRRVPGLGRGLIVDLTEFDEPLPDEFWFGKS